MGWSIYERQPEEDLFRRLPDGWVFSAPRVWLGGPARSYLVNDVQKAELLARLGRWRIVWLVLFAALLVSCGSLSLLWTSDWINFATLAAGLALSGFLLFGVAIPSAQLIILQPILASAMPITLARAPIRTGVRDSLLADSMRQARTYSLRWLTVSCLVFGCLGIKSGYDALTSQGDYVYALAMLFFFADSSVALFLKLRERRSSARRAG